MRTTAHTARKPHTCARCRSRIQPGERYLAHVASPQHDGLGNEDWWRLAECAACAETCGRPIESPAGATP